MSAIMNNARMGIIHQYELDAEVAASGDFDLACEHFKAAELLEDFLSDFIPCLPEEL